MRSAGSCVLYIIDVLPTPGASVGAANRMLYAPLCEDSCSATFVAMPLRVCLNN